MIKFNLKHKQAALREEDDVKFIPYTRHVSDDVIALADGSLMRMYRVDGRPFETSDVADLNNWHNKLNIAWRTIGDDRVAVWSHLVRTATDPRLMASFTLISRAICKRVRREAQKKQSLPQRVLRDARGAPFQHRG
jgi:type IV secretion system protein VirB4